MCVLFMKQRERKRTLCGGGVKDFPTFRMVETRASCGSQQASFLVFNRFLTSSVNTKIRGQMKQLHHVFQENAVQALLAGCCSRSVQDKKKEKRMTTTWSICGAFTHVACCSFPKL